MQCSVKAVNFLPVFYRKVSMLPSALWLFKNTELIITLGKIQEMPNSI